MYSTYCTPYLMYYNIFSCSSIVWSGIIVFPIGSPNKKSKYNQPHRRVQLLNVSLYLLVRSTYTTSTTSPWRENRPFPRPCAI